MTFSEFAAYLNSTKLPVAVRREVREEAVRRVTERMLAGRGDFTLTFTDLFNKCEAAAFGA